MRSKRFKVRLRRIRRYILFEIAKGVLLSLIERQQKKRERDRYKITIHKGVFFDTETWEEK